MGRKTAPRKKENEDGKRKIKRKRLANAAKRIAKTEAAKSIVAPQIGDRVKTSRKTNP